MIKQAEIKKISEQLGVPKTQIDKDWVLAYLLYGITSMPEMKDILVFKGGTSLKKCRFPNYRFSEDLDFTILENKFIFDKKYVKKITQKATELSFDEDYNRGILFKIKEIVHTHSRDVEQGFKVFIYYWGADHRKNDLPSASAKNWYHTIKLDINHTEEILFSPELRSIYHTYSDKAVFENFKVNTYSFEEVLSEKLRSLIQRKYTSPRDCYDIWYLKNNVPELNWKNIKNGFFRKAASKNIKFSSVRQLINPQKERILKAHWNTQLANQFPKGKLPGYEIVVPELNAFLNELFN